MFRPLTTLQVWVDVAVAAAFFLVALPVELGVGQTGALPTVLTGIASALIALVFAGALGVRRLSPALALALAWAGAIIQMSLGRPPTLADVAIFGVLYATAAYGSPRVYWWGFASALTGAVVITLYLFAGPAFAGVALSLHALPLAFAVLIAAVFALMLAWTIGALVRTSARARANRAAQVQAEADAAAEHERTRIARDMHDVVAHSLAVVIAQADGARYAAGTDPTAATAALGTISTTARAALADVRLLLTQLRHQQSDGPQPTLADLEELYAQVRAAGVELRIDVDPAPAGEPSAAVQLALYRILQEALTNALRHGGGGPVALTLSWRPDAVEFAVRNRVATAEPVGAGADHAGHGLIGMTERAGLVGGRVTAARDGQDFVVSGVLPVAVAA